MEEVFLEIPVSKSLLTDLKEYQLPLPVFQNSEIAAIIFENENDFCECLSALEKASDSYLSEYWLFKTPELIEKSRSIIRVLTILNEARIKKYPEFDGW